MLLVRPEGVPVVNLTSNVQRRPAERAFLRKGHGRVAVQMVKTATPTATAASQSLATQVRPQPTARLPLRRVDERVLQVDERVPHAHPRAAAAGGLIATAGDEAGPPSGAPLLPVDPTATANSGPGPYVARPDAGRPAGPSVPRLSLGTSSLHSLHRAVSDGGASLHAGPSFLHNPRGPSLHTLDRAASDGEEPNCYQHMSLQLSQYPPPSRQVQDAITCPLECTTE